MPAIAASGSSESFHGIGIQTCDQAHSAARPIVPISAPAIAPFTTGLRPPARSEDRLDQQRLDDVEREVRRDLAPDDADHERQEAADDEVAAHGQERAAAAGVEAAGDQPDAGGEHDQDRLVDLAELRHAEVELGLEGRERDEEAAHQQRAAHVVDAAAWPRARGRARSP